MQINGNQLFVKTYGDPKKETIVFLNGVAASVSSWNYYVDALKNDYHIVCHDFKGQLLSDKPEGPYTFYEHARDTIEILRDLGIEKAHFIGTSYGGEVAMKTAIKFPEYVHSLMVINSVSEIDRKIKKTIKEWIKLAQKGDGYRFMKEVIEDLYGKRYIQTHVAYLEERAKAMMTIDPNFFKGQITLYETFIKEVFMTDELFMIKAPTLIIAGAEDTLKPPKFSEIIHERIRQSEYKVFDDCGHVTIYEQPELLLEEIKAFIRKNKM